MRKLTVLMQTTLDGRISTADGLFWQPFAWGEEETAYVNQAFARADTWAMACRGRCQKVSQTVSPEKV